MSDQSGNRFSRILGKVKPAPPAQSAWGAPAKPSPLRPPAAGETAAPGAGPGRASGPSPADWAPGQKLLDDFAVERVLGEGGMGKVYLARSWSLAGSSGARATKS